VGSYFAGRVFVEELAKQPDSAIYVFNRGHRPLGMIGITELVGDREQAEQIQRVIPAKEWDAVVDFCAYTPAHVKSLLDNLPGKIMQYIFITPPASIRKAGTCRLQKTACNFPARNLSSAAMQIMATTKVMAESMLQHTCESLGIAYTILRPTIIYGYYNYAPREKLLFRFAAQPSADNHSIARHGLVQFHLGRGYGAHDHALHR